MDSWIEYTWPKLQVAVLWYLFDRDIWYANHNFSVLTQLLSYLIIF
jgi:hypothetical protein